MTVAALSLAGIVPFSGFWSKDAVLSATYAQAVGSGGPGYLVLLILALATVFLTAFYMFRVIFILGHGRSDLYLHKELGVIAAPLVILAVPSVLVGLWGSPLLGEGFQRFLEGAHFQPEEINLPMAALSTILGLAGIGMAYLMYSRQAISAAAVTRAFGPLYRLPANKYFLDDLYLTLFGIRTVQTSAGPQEARGLLLKFADFLAFVFDRRVVDGVVNGIGALAVGLSARARQVQTGQVQSYGTVVFVGLALISVFTILIRTMAR